MSESFGNYQLHELISEDNSEVYRAFDTTAGRVVALKLLTSDATEDPAFEERFRREAHVAAGLSDPHLIPIHSHGEIDGRLYLDMQLIEGRDLRAILERATEPLSPSTAVDYVAQAAKALDAAHSAGWTHRDVTPSNILVTDRGHVYLTTAAIGRSADEDAGETRPDVHGLTHVLYECLTGQPPSADDTVELPAAFDAVIERGLAKDPSERYQTAQELAAAARKALPRTARVRAAIRRRGKPTAPEQEPLTAAKPASEPAAVAGATKTRTATPDHSDSGTYWNALWIVLLIAAAVLAAIIMAIV